MAQRLVLQFSPDLIATIMGWLRCAPCLFAASETCRSWRDVILVTHASLVGAAVLRHPSLQPYDGVESDTQLELPTALRDGWRTRCKAARSLGASWHNDQVPMGKERPDRSMRNAVPCLMLRDSVSCEILAVPSHNPGGLQKRGRPELLGFDSYVRAVHVDWAAQRLVCGLYSGNVRSRRRCGQG